MKKLTFLLPAAFLLSGCSLLPGQTSNISGTESQKMEKLGQIIASGGQADCQITNLTDNTTTQIVVSGKKMKFMGSDFGEGKKGTMLTDDVYTYVWSDGEETGFKTKLETEKVAEPTEAVREQGGLDQTQKIDSYDDETKFKTVCTRRTITESEFTPPSNIKFTDFAELMKDIPSIPNIPAQDSGE